MANTLGTIGAVPGRDSRPVGSASEPGQADARRMGRPSGADSDARTGQAQQPYVLVLHFAVVNLAAFSLLGAAYVQGWLTPIVESDSTGLSVAIFAVFLGGLAVCAHKIYVISCELGCVRNFNPCRRSWAATYLSEVAGRGSGSRAITASALRVKISNRIVTVRHVANSLVLLGLIGTVIGFIIALSGVDPKAAGNVQYIAPMEDSDDGTVFRDVIMLALLGFATIVILLLPHLNPPVKSAEQARPPGNIIVEVRWPDELDTDVDLWVEASGDVPVGYSNKGGRIFNLLRDDLGHEGDATQLNYEVAFSRGAPAGEYTVNLHLYRNNSDRLPIPAIVTVSVKADPDSAAKSVATERVQLDRVGQELTVIRFSLDDFADLVPGSLHRLQRGLRSARR